jgi:hypothetical protein
MGILDDAIREHLELKRQHGASDEELRQQEVEALGAPAAPEPEDLEEAADAELQHDAEPVDGNGAAPPAEEPVAEEPVAQEPVDEEPEALVEPEPFAEPEHEPEPEPEPEPVVKPASEEDADVLEDTPDFLQETPEHDRLWFEQKPPRDFDFD